MKNTMPNPTSDRIKYIVQTIVKYCHEDTPSDVHFHTSTYAQALEMFKKQCTDDAKHMAVIGEGSCTNILWDVENKRIEKKFVASCECND